MQRRGNICKRRTARRRQKDTIAVAVAATRGKLGDNVDHLREGARMAPQ